MDLKEVEYAVY